MRWPTLSVQSQTAGAIGATGLATGPHTHFRVRQNGVAREPLRGLPAR